MPALEITNLNENETAKIQNGAEPNLIEKIFLNGKFQYINPDDKSVHLSFEENAIETVMIGGEPLETQYRIVDLPLATKQDIFSLFDE